MTYQAPFTAHIKVVPSRGRSTTTTGSLYKEPGHVRRGGKFDYIRDLQRLAGLVYEELEDNAPRITLPSPGGSQNRLFGFNSNLRNGTGAKPQIGNAPAQLMVEGFFRASDIDPSLVQPFARKPVIHGGEAYSGFGGQWAWDPDGMPGTVEEAEVLELKLMIEDAISAVSDDSGIALGVFRLQYKSATWGDGGHHFPRP